MGVFYSLGRLTVPAFDPYAAFPDLFVFLKNGAMTGMDWLGGQLAWAIGFVSGIGGHLIFAAAAALALVAVTAVVTRKFGPAWGALAALIFVGSPMSASLSFTTHAHLLSRAFLACALYFYVSAREESAKRSWAACGFFLALAFCCRPFETAFLALPFGIELLWSAAKGDRSLARGVAIAVAGGLSPGPSFRGACVGAHRESAASAATLERSGEQCHPQKVPYGRDSSRIRRSISSCSLFGSLDHSVACS